VSASRFRDLSAVNAGFRPRISLLGEWDFTEVSTAVLGSLAFGRALIDSCGVRRTDSHEKMVLYMLQRFLSVADAERALRVFGKLARHDIGRWALTGGIAVEIHLLRLGRQPSIRVLNDLDFIADSFDCIPETLTADFVFRHIHSLDPPGKTMLQFIDPDNATRIDVFRAYGATMSRAFRLDLPSGAIRVISLEDLVARTARLTLDIAEGVAVPSKHASDFLRLTELVDPSQVEIAWQDHRKPKHPATFAESNNLLQHLILTRPQLLITPHYSHDTKKLCPRCEPTAAFRLADPNLIIALLGYC
jgi:hypothetical protein